MLNIITTCLLIILFFLLGYITQVFKAILGLITNIFLTLGRILGIKIHDKERTEKISNDFKIAYKDVRKVKLSRKNIKQKSSIDWINLSIFVITLIITIINLNVVSGSIITKWFYSLLGADTKILDISTVLTAIQFSILSFSLGKIISRWKETKQQRIESKELKIKQKALTLLNSKELLDNAKKKDEENYRRLK